MATNELANRCTMHMDDAEHTERALHQVDQHILSTSQLPLEERLGSGRTGAVYRSSLNGHAVAVLHTLVGNTPAIALYEAQGWVVTDETHIEDLPNGSTYTEHVLRKPLQPGG